ncbi:MAG TPA: ArsA-related P-loop ATPase [Acidimicrobiales bacterium]|nr:ArsA-related P-loop ATPase [Acidimicrobiales bacterium]
MLIVAGTGGVGKTTVSAAIARMGARAGLKVLLVEVEGKSGLAGSFGHAGPLSYRETVLSEDRGGSVRGRTLTPDDALVEYLEQHGMKRISRRLISSGAIEVVATAVPGIKDILVLGKVKALERDSDADVIVLDAPAAGHAITFLSSANGLLDAVRVGPIRAQAEEVVGLLSDAARCQVLLVTLPEETPVNELVETGFALEDRVGVSLAPVVVNGLYPALGGLDVGAATVAADAEVHLRPGEAETLDEAAAFRRTRQELQSEQVARLAEALPLPQLRLPFLFTTDVGPAELDVLADALAASLAEIPGPAAR